MTITKELLPCGAALDCRTVAVHIVHMGNEWWIPSKVECSEHDWDTISGEIRSSDPECRVKNDAVDTFYRQVSATILNRLDLKVLDSLRELFSCTSDGAKPTDDTYSNGTFHDSYIIRSKLAADPDAEISFFEVIDRRMSTIHTLNTRRGYEQFRRYVTRRMPNVPASEFSQEYINQFVKNVNSDYHNKFATSNIHLSKMRAVINYGKRNGLIDPRINIEFPRSRYFAKDRNLSIEELSRIYTLFKTKVNTEGELRRPRVFALALFIFDIAFQGLAPRDIASLKVGDLKRQTVYVGGSISHKYLSSRFLDEIVGEEQSRIECIIVNTSRQKTGNPVTIVSDIEPIEPVVRILTEGKSPDDYLIPCFSARQEYTDSQLQNRLANYFNRNASYLNRYLNDCDTQICQHGTRISFYYARHAFCNCVDCLDIPRNLIQNMVGHRTTVLENSYLRPISIRDQALVSRALFRFLDRFSSL